MFETPSIFHGQTDSKHLSGCPSPSKQQYGLVANHSRRQLAAASGWCAAWCIKFKSKFVSEAMVYQTHQTRFVLSYDWQRFQIFDFQFVYQIIPIGLALRPCPSQDLPGSSRLPTVAMRHSRSQSCRSWYGKFRKLLEIDENCTLIDDDRWSGYVISSYFIVI